MDIRLVSLKKVIVLMSGIKFVWVLFAFGLVSVLLFSVFKTCIFSKNCLNTENPSNSLGINKEIQAPRKYNDVGKYAFNKVLITPEKVPNKLFFLVLITSSARPIGKTRRDAIRKTWGNCHGKELQLGLVGSKFDQSSSSRKQNNGMKYYNYCRVVFSIGVTKNIEMQRSVLQESSEHKDIFVSDVVDNYQNLTFKLRTVFHYYSSTDVKYVVKADSDVYINLIRLAKLLANDKSLPEFLYGGFPYTGIVVRDPKHRHFVHKEDYAEKYYPSFCKGSMVLLSGNVFSLLSKAFTHIKPFNIDDAYLGITLHKLGVPAVKIDQFVQFQHSPVMLELLHLCDFSWLIGIGDSFSPVQLKQIHKLMALSDKLPAWMCWHFSHLGYFVLIMLLFALYIGLTKLFPR